MKKVDMLTWSKVDRECRGLIYIDHDCDDDVCGFGTTTASLQLLSLWLQSTELKHQCVVTVSTQTCDMVVYSAHGFCKYTVVVIITVTLQPPSWQIQEPMNLCVITAISFLW